MKKFTNTLETALGIVIISLPTVLILITLILGPKTLSTSHQLWRISGDIEYVNEIYKHNWNENADEKYEKLNAERNALYNSDGYVGWFANQHNAIQLLLVVVFTAVLGFCLISPIIVMSLYFRNKTLQEKLEKIKRAKSQKR